MAISMHHITDAAKKYASWILGEIVEANIRGGQTCSRQKQQKYPDGKEYIYVHGWCKAFHIFIFLCLLSYLKGVKYAVGNEIKVTQSLNEKFMSDEETDIAVWKAQYLN